jgi:hypothetical protein
MVSLAISKHLMARSKSLGLEVSGFPVKNETTYASSIGNSSGLFR